MPPWLVGQKWGQCNLNQACNEEVNCKFNKSFDLKYCRTRVGRLKNRFRVFNWIINLSGVCYDEATNKVTCSDYGWNFICEKEKLARCYIELGEAQYNNLRCLFQFGLTQKVQEQRHIINIASDNEEENNLENIREVAEKEDPYFWDDVAEEFNEPSDSKADQPACHPPTLSFLN